MTVATFATIAMLASIGQADVQEKNWAIELDLRLGSFDDPGTALTTPGAVVVGKNGRIFLSQPVDRLVRVFDGEGEFLRTIGRRGRGPGEFVSISRIGFVGDTLWVADEALGRITFF